MGDAETGELTAINEYFQATHGAGWEELKGQTCKIKLAGDGDSTLEGKFLGLVQSRSVYDHDGVEVVVEVEGLPILYRMHPSWLLF